jgi:tRNA (adenine37-N6)-methyltransferase
MKSFTVEPIGVMRTPFADKAQIPRQASLAEGVRGVIELEPGRDFADALDGLEGFDMIWVLFWFHENGGQWRPKVTPPRSSEKRGLFATRSPHRPNPIGLSAVRLERIEGLSLHVANVDILDGTPVIDIKPYVAYADALSPSKAGWLDGAADPAPRYGVVWEDAAEAQLAWLGTRGGETLASTVETVLKAGPKPHAYRRIREISPGRYQLAVKSWRFVFRDEGDRQLHIEKIDSGYRPAQLLAAPRAEDEEELSTHRAYVARFGG